jgi:hypothetical protein
MNKGGPKARDRIIGAKLRSICTKRRSAIVHAARQSG